MERPPPSDRARAGREAPALNAFGGVRSVLVCAPPILRGACLGRPMPEDRRRRSPFRLLAPLALLLCAAAITAVVLSSNVVDSGNGNEAASTAGDGWRPDHHRAQRPRRRLYTVKLNDSLGSIAEKTGVPVERLEAQPGARPTGTRGGPEDQAARVRATAASGGGPGGASARRARCAGPDHVSSRRERCRLGDRGRRPQRRGDVREARRRPALDRLHHQADDRAPGPRARPAERGVHRAATTPCRSSRRSTCVPASG